MPVELSENQFLRELQSASLHSRPEGVGAGDLPGEDLVSIQGGG